MLHEASTKWDPYELEMDSHAEDGPETIRLPFRDELLRTVIGGWLSAPDILFRNKYFVFRELELYLRRRQTRLKFLGRDVRSIDIARIDVDERFQGQGLFTRILREMLALGQEHNRIVTIESVLNDEFLRSLERRGFVRYDWRSYVPPGQDLDRATVEYLEEV
jgi:GNAT superfamily N-acetyltransferase